MPDQTRTADETPPASTVAAASPPGMRTRLRRLLRVSGSLQAYIGVVLVILLGLATKGEVFWNQTNLTNAVGAFASRGILAVGVTLVILTGGIDLSVGSVLAFSSMTSALLLVNHHLYPWEIIPVCMLVGMLFGIANGLGTTWLRIQSFVMTLAMMSVARGMTRQLH